VTNTGGVALTGGTFTITGSTTFTGGGCLGTLAVGATCTYSVVFTPTAVTSYSGSAAIAYNGVTGSAVSLSGTGVAAGALAFTAATNASLSPNGKTLTFTIPTPRAPVTSVVTIKNTGTAATAPTPVTITGESVTGIANNLFSLAGTTCGATLAPGATCTITITYATPAAPPNPQHRNGTAAVANNGSGTTAGSTTLSLAGR
jgi:hypothetical protein